MKTLGHLFEKNRAWAAQLSNQKPELLDNLAQGQNPPYMWIGCSDSRVPANELLGISAGEVFVYRNVANQVQPSDAGVTAALYYAIVVLKVRHILVCGHYNCGGVAAALEHNTPGPLGSWLLPLQVIVEKYKARLDAFGDFQTKHDALGELNVVEQVRTIASLPFVRSAWANGQELDIHGWMFRINKGLLEDLNLCVRAADNAEETCDSVMERVLATGHA